MRSIRSALLSRFTLRYAFLVACSLTFLFPKPGNAQEIPKLSPDAKAWMVTILPGDAVYTEFGHSAIRIADPVHQLDRLYNYGTFNFNEPFFVLKFTYGQLNYMLTTEPYGPALPFYKRVERPIIEQRLNLTAGQVQDLYAFLEVNARPENRTYRYDFLFDNCSTRVRDALESAVGPLVQFSGEPNPGKSFRRLLDPYVADRRLLDVGFDLGLGKPADQIASPREAMFLPDYLFEAFENAKIMTPDGPEPLVTKTDTLFWVDGYEATEATFPWPLVLTWGLLGVGAVWTVRQARVFARGPRDTDVGAWGDATLFGISGLAGLIICFLWFISEHQVTDQNWNLFWAWPTHLALTVAIVRNVRPQWIQGYTAVAAISTGLLAAGWFLWPQDLHNAIFPIALLLTLRLGWFAYRLSPEQSTIEQPPERSETVEASAPTP
ncbi:DUF4105 domain-containing protein [Longibacter salinarum]|nr:DUF4105 domain-containing protein [Longibacter salinarum]